MTAKDSKSTPKKAESATRHPLALLADYVEACQQWDGIDGEGEGRMIAADQALFALDPAALRTQAEADRVAVPRGTVENLLTAWDEGLWGPETQDAGVPGMIVGLVDDLRAALAQAGGEG